MSNDLAVQPAIVIFDKGRAEACGVAPVGVADPTFFAPITKAQREAGGVRALATNDAGEMVAPDGTVVGVPVSAEVNPATGGIEVYANGKPIGISVSVRQFGVVGDGIADDTLALQAAVNSGKNIIIDCTLKISAAITISSTSKQVITLKDGMIKLSSNASAFVLDGKSSLVGGTIDCGGFNSGSAAVRIVSESASAIGVSVINSANDGVKLEAGGSVVSCKITNGSGADKYGIYDFGVGSSHIVNNTVSNWSGNGIFVNGNSISSSKIKEVFGNTVSGITNSSGSGAYGNGISAWNTSNLIVSDNRVDACTYSNIRINGCVGYSVIDNVLSNPGLFTSPQDEHCVYSEFAHSGGVISGNVLDGGNLVVANQLSSGGKDTVISGNRISNGVIMCEGDAVISSNLIRLLAAYTLAVNKSGIVLGWSTYCKNISCIGNQIVEERAAGILAGISAVYVYGSTANLRNVAIQGNTVDGAKVPVAGHKDGVSVTSAGSIEPLPKYVFCSGNGDGFIDRTFLSKGGSYNSQISYLVGKIRKGQQTTFFTSNKYPYQRLVVNVYGDKWESVGGAHTQYVVCYSGGLGDSKRITCERHHGSKYNHVINVYEDADYYYVVVTFSNFWATTVEAFINGSGASGTHDIFNDGVIYQKVTEVSSAFIAALTDVTSSFPIITMFTTDSSGNFGNDTATYAGGHLVIGSNHLWVDGAGKLRIKSSAPASDTDGAIVGVQT